MDKPRVTFFNAPRQIIVLVQVEGRMLAVYRDDVKGRTVTVNLGLPAGLSLLRLHAKIAPHRSGPGKRRRVYFRNPPTCPASGQWTTTVKFTYLDGSTDEHSDGTPCASDPHHEAEQEDRRPLEVVGLAQLAERLAREIGHRNGQRREQAGHVARC